MKWLTGRCLNGAMEAWQDTDPVVTEHDPTPTWGPDHETL